MLGAQDVLGAERIPVLMGEFRGDPTRERRYMETFSARQVDGLIVASRRIESVQALRASPGIPAVYAMGRPVGEGVSVLPDVEGGARMAAEHLLAIGCRRIAHVTGPECMPAARLQAMGSTRHSRLPGSSCAAASGTGSGASRGGGKRSVGC